MIAEYLNWDIDDTSKQRVLSALAVVLEHVKDGTLETQHLASHLPGLTASMLRNLRSPEPMGKETPVEIAISLMDAYPISHDQHLLRLICTDGSGPAPGNIRSIYSLVAELGDQDGDVAFSAPLLYRTRHWKSETVGHARYVYRDRIDRTRAERFDEKHTIIARKFGLEPDALTFYMCDDYQEILPLLGFDFDRDSAGSYRDGYGVDSGFIFSIMNNEDFSHDVFHYYSGKVNQWDRRNWITEEGVAYSWGNAYYTDPEGEMIEQSQLVDELSLYLSAHPAANLLDLFEKNTKIFDHLAPEVSVRSTISGLICGEVERKRGMEGLQVLINCGRGMDAFMKTVEELLGIDRNTFHHRVSKLIENPKPVGPPSP